MNFQNLKAVESADWYIDVAFRRGKEAAGEITSEDFPKLSRTDLLKKREDRRVRKIESSLNKHLSEIQRKFPVIDDLPEFYKELLSSQLDINRLKKALSSIIWSVKRIESFSREYQKKMRLARVDSLVRTLSKAFLGRVSSILKRMKNNLAYLEHARKMMKRFPTIKTSRYTVVIYGFPNVGKTTLLSRLTGSSPEINEYAFTTKDINIGNIKTEYGKIQLVDTPGTLDRKEKMNSIEFQAELVLRLVADAIIYVMDLTESYPIDKQKKLLKKIKSKKMGKPILLFLSKEDLLSDEQKNSEKKGMTDVEKLKKEIIRLQRDQLRGSSQASYKTLS